jgi:hypothetical protein
MSGKSAGGTVVLCNGKVFACKSLTGAQDKSKMRVKFDGELVVRNVPECYRHDCGRFIQTEIVPDVVRYTLSLSMERHGMRTQCIRPWFTPEQSFFCHTIPNPDHHRLRIATPPVICAEVNTIGNGIVEAYARRKRPAVVELHPNISSTNLDLAVPLVKGIRDGVVSRRVLLPTETYGRDKGEKK